MRGHKVEVLLVGAEDENLAGVGADDEEGRVVRTFDGDSEVDRESVSVNRDRLKAFRNRLKTRLRTRIKVLRTRLMTRLMTRGRRNLPDFDGGIGRGRGEHERVGFGLGTVDAGDRSSVAFENRETGKSGC